MTVDEQSDIVVLGDENAKRSTKNKPKQTYHIMLRGINQQQIFEDEEDYRKFVEVLKNYQAICGYTIYAYCLMGNHIHLLMRFNNER